MKSLLHLFHRGGELLPNRRILGKLPIKIQLGADYSVVHEDDFGDRWKFKLLIPPVIPSMIKKPLFD